MSAKMHPRAQAFERNKQHAICAVRGHRPPVVRWYSADRRDKPCLRCGELVRPTLDMSGHP